MRPRRVAPWLAALLCAASARSPAAAPAGFGLPQLMAELARVKSATASFTERRSLHLLKTPLISTGTLDYVAPDRLEKITRTPTPGRFVLDGNRVTMTTGPDHQTRSFSLDQAPEIAGLIEGIRATLAGDLPLLKRLYHVRLAGDAAHWQLTLKPGQQRLARLVTEIRIAGTGDRITTIDTQDANGDRAETSIAETTVNAR